MGWPSRQDYREALQACDIAFSDPDLKTAGAVCDPLGMPRAFSGQNATVFQMRSGSRTWAVKCFAHDTPDQQQRYAAISSHLERARLPYTVGFKFLEHGVNVGGTWYPVLKMEWVEGESLKRYIERSLGDGGALRQLALRVLQMVKALQAAGIAHGDLQHGNVLVCGQDLRLVDYDGMFVPGLAGSLSAELGHPNYQHPGRVPAHFNVGLDNFSAWVIVLSLYATSVLPELWDSTGHLDECLLFRRKDFEAPYASQVLQRIANARDPVLQQLALRFQVVLYGSPDEAILPEVQSSPSVPAATPVSPLAGSWIDDHRPRGAGGGQPVLTAAGTAPSPAGEPDSTWLVGWVKKPGRSAALQNPVVLERSAAISTLVIGASLGLFLDGLDGYLAACVLSLCTANLMLLKTRYEAEPDVERLMKLLDEERALDRHIGIRQRSVKATESEKVSRERKTADEVSRLRNEEKVLRAREVGDVEQLYVMRDKRLRELATGRAKLDLEEAQELARVRQTSQSRIKALDTTLAALQSAEAEELSQSLKSLQAQHVQSYLKGTLVERATISGIGFKLKDRLIAAGFRSAADIDYYRVLRVERIGPQLGTALVAWRKDAERAAARTIPAQLPRGDEAAIRSRHAGQIQGVMSQRAREVAQLQTDEQAIRSKYATVRADLPKQENQAKIAADTDERDTRARYAQRYAELVDKVRSVEVAGAAQVAEIQPQLAKFQKDLAALRWKKEMLRLETEQMAAVSFGSYLRRVFLGA